MSAAFLAATCAVVAIVFTWVCYPCLIFVAAIARRRKPEAHRDGAPGRMRRVSVVIATRDDPDAVRRRVKNIVETAGGAGDVEIIIAVDPTSANSVGAYRDALPSTVIVVEGDAPGGKALTLTAGVRASAREILVFADSAQAFREESPILLLEAFDDPTVGAASGTLVPENNRRSLVLRLFWIYESWLRKSESKFDSLVGVTGAIYAIRRTAWQALPAGLILDDVFVAFAVVEQGMRVVQVNDAVAVDRRVFTADEEFIRRVRTQTGLLQLCVLRPRILNPLKTRIWIQFVLHKMMRIASPFLGVVALVGLAVDKMSAVVAAALVAVVALVFVLLRIAPQGTIAARVASQIRWAILLLVAPVVAFGHATRCDWDVWKQSTQGNPKGRGS